MKKKSLKLNKRFFQDVVDAISTSISPQHIIAEIDKSVICYCYKTMNEGREENDQYQPEDLLKIIDDLRDRSDLTSDELCLLQDTQRLYKQLVQQNLHVTRKLRNKSEPLYTSVWGRMEEPEIKQEVKGAIMPLMDQIDNVLFPSGKPPNSILPSQSTTDSNLPPQE